jgi:hypothetical protein
MTLVNEELELHWANIAPCSQFVTSVNTTRQ